VKTFHTDWYAAFVKVGAEDDVKARLEYKVGENLHFLFPKRKLLERKDGVWHEVLRPLFPGYLLINGEIGIKEYYNLKDVPGLWKLLSSGSELLPIPNMEIDPISRLITYGEIIGPSELQEEGGCVHVIDGPLTGMEGRIIKIDRRKGRAKVMMTFLNEARIIDLAVKLLA